MLIEPILVDTSTACRLLSIRRTLLFQYLRDGILVRRKAGRKTLVTIQSIRALADGRSGGDDVLPRPANAGSQVVTP